MEELLETIRLALTEIMDEVNYDCLNCEDNWDVVATAAEAALDAIEQFAEDHPLPF